MGKELSKATHHRFRGEQADVSIRVLRTTAELGSCVELQRRIWGGSFVDVVPASLLQVSHKIGGITAGAYLNGSTDLIGFVYGLTGVREGRLSHWSHMLGVLPEHRGLGIGQRLKRFQRRRVRELGVQEILWSFDPLMAGNAHFNLNLLHVEIDSYEPEMYGDTGSALHSFGTDRFVARWDLSAQDGGGAGAGAGGRPRDGEQEQVQDLPLANVLPGTNGPAPGGAGDGSGARLRIEIPRDIFRINQEDPGLAAAWRHSTRTAFKQCFGAGYRVSGFMRLEGGGRCVYVMERGGETATQPYV